MSELFSQLRQHRKKLMQIFVVLIICLNVIVDQSVNTTLIESVRPLESDFNGWLTSCYLVLSIFGALVLAGWSDFHCRKKTIVFALICMFLSFLFMTLYKLFGFSLIGIIALFVKAMFGNVTPVSFAMLADITSKKNFRNILALALVGYSIGIWAPIYFRSSIETEWNFMVFAVIIMAVITCTILFVKDDHFDNVKFSRNRADIKLFIAFFKKESKLIALFLMSPIIAPAILCYLFGEISYYQFLLRGELISEPDFYEFQALVLAVGYYIGTAILLVLGGLNIKDMTCIKMGLLISLVSSGMILLGHYIYISGAVLNVLIALFSVGFSLVTPSLFASISKVSLVEEQGKIYGSMDSTDTFAALSSALIIKRTESFPTYLVLLFTFLIFFISCVFFLQFLRRYRQINHAS